MADPGRSIEAERKSADSLPDLIAGALRGDSRAFERLYRLHVDRIYALCLRLVADPVRAESLVQDVFVRVWKKLGSYGGRGSFAGWLRRLAVNVVIEDCRAEAKRAKWFGQGLETERTGQPDARITSGRPWQSRKRETMQ